MKSYGYSAMSKPKKVIKKVTKKKAAKKSKY